MFKHVFTTMILGLATGAAVAAGGKGAAKDVPQTPPAVVKAFQKAYPDAQEVKHDKETTYEIEFKLAGKEMEAVYDDEGTLIYAKGDIGVGDLPSAVMAAIALDFPHARFEEAEKLVNPDGSLRGYEVEIEEGGEEWEIELDAAGKIVKVKAD